MKMFFQLSLNFINIVPLILIDIYVLFNKKKKHNYNVIIYTLYKLINYHNQRLLTKIEPCSIAHS